MYKEMKHEIPASNMVSVTRMPTSYLSAKVRYDAVLVFFEV